MAMMASVFTLMVVSSFDMDDRPDVILLKLNTAKAAAAVIAMSRNSLSTPPSLSASHVTAFLTRFSTDMTC